MSPTLLVELAQEGSPTGVLNGSKLLKTARGIFCSIPKNASVVEVLPRLR
jgi:hypothetical protein